MAAGLEFGVFSTMLTLGYIDYMHEGIYMAWRDVNKKGNCAK